MTSLWRGFSCCPKSAPLLARLTLVHENMIMGAQWNLVKFMAKLDTFVLFIGKNSVKPLK
jgi:hypothetical protein